MGFQEETNSKLHDAEGAEAEASTGITEEIPSVQPRRQQTIPLNMSSRILNISSDEFVKIDMPPTPSPTSTAARLPPRPIPNSTRINDSTVSSSKTKPSIKNLIPRLSFKFRNATSDMERDFITEGRSSGVAQEKSSIPRSPSLSKIFGNKFKRTASLPDISGSNPEAAQEGSTNGAVTPIEKEPRRHISRSLSVPMNNRTGAMRRSESLRGVFRVIPSTSRVMEEGGAILNTNASKENAETEDGDGEHIAEEEAVCRICLVELGEGGETFKLECSCKGELALAHKECALKWFSIKGNKSCDVCQEEVQNLPVTLLFIQNAQANGQNRSQQATRPYRIWQDVPVLVIVSMLAYFCYLEQLLVGKMGSGAIAISLPFSCILGLLAAMTSSTMVVRKYVWLYAFIQYILVVLSAHLFYNLFHIQAVLSILLSTFAGFGVTMSVNSVLVEVLRWRGRVRARASHSHSQDTQWERMPGPGSTPQTNPGTETTVPQHENWERLSDVEHAPQTNPSTRYEIDTETSVAQRGN